LFDSFVASLELNVTLNRMVFSLIDKQGFKQKTRGKGVVVDTLL